MAKLVHAGAKTGPMGGALLLCLTLVGCGFQLKGTGDSGASQTLAGVEFFLISSQPRGELTAAVANQLRLEGAVISPESDGALRLRLGEERFQQRNLSLTAQARSAEVELTMTVALSLRREDRDLIATTDAQVVRQFLNDPRNVVGKTEELRLLREEMRSDLAAQITRRITHSLNN
jgi:LPS-assembly lipoprotein